MYLTANEPYNPTVDLSVGMDVTEVEPPTYEVFLPVIRNNGRPKPFSKKRATEFLWLVFFRLGYISLVLIQEISL